MFNELLAPGATTCRQLNCSMDNSRKAITIIGGGPAGLTLGIALRQREAPVTVWEAGRYPRHRVCGEFISGQGLETLGRLGLIKKLEQAGARPARTVAFYSAKMAALKMHLARPALCLSRYKLDAFLAREFQLLGGELREGERWREDFFGDGIVRATGRCVQPIVDGWRWIGLKAHARQVALEADLEMHVLPDAYMGLCKLSDRTVNICGLFRSKVPLPDLAVHWKSYLQGAPGSPLQARLATAVFDRDSFRAVAGLCLQPRRATDHQGCCLGDALSMIAPITGNGMSMAIESAELALEPICAYVCGKSTWEISRRMIGERCDNRFASRLRWASRLQNGLFNPWLQSLLFLFGGHSAAFRSKLFNQTR